MEDYYEYLDSNGVTTLYKLIKDDTVALIDSYSVTVNGITTTLDNHINNSDIHTPISDIENMVNTKISGLVNSAPETLDTLKELSDALGNDPNFATTVANQIGNKASKDSVYTKEETNTLLEDKANSVHSHVVSDITNFPTIPTKTSELINDSGFLTSSSGLITSVSWTNITDKPNFSTVATSGSYTDLSNTPTIPTKLSQLENDMGFGTGGGSGDTSDCVHKTGDEIISGNKTFTDKIICTRFTHSVNNGSTYITGGSEYDKGATLVLHGEDSSDAGSFIINSRDKTRSLYLVGKPDGTLQWAGQNIALDENLVHKTGNETIAGTKMFTNNIHKKNSGLDLQVNPSANQYNGIIFTDKNNVAMAYLEHIQTTAGINIIGVYARDKSNGTHGIQITSENNVKPLGDNTYNLGLSGARWKSVYATTYYGNLVGGITLNQTSLKMTVKDSNSETTRTNDVILANSSNTSYGINVAFGGSGNTVVGAGESYTAQLNELAGNSQENLYLTADNNVYIKVGANTFANAKTIIISSAAELSGLAKVTSTSFVGALTGNVTGNCSGSSSSCTGNSATATSANSATYSTTPATTDNSTRIATTAWVRTYVDSVAGSNTVGSSVSAYWSNSSNVTATGQASAHSSSSTIYPACYSDYINKTPTVGTIYSGAQLYTEYGTSASATGTLQSQSQYSTRITTTTAQVTFRSPISATGKYLCTTANTVKFRAYTTQGSTSTVGASSIVDYTITKSIFIRVE